MKVRALAVSAVSALMVVPLLAAGGTPASADDTAPTTVAEPGGSDYSARIRITEHGIPHITGATYADAAYGAGWATAAAATCTLMDTLLTARGQRSLHLGPDEKHTDYVSANVSNLQWDTLVTDMRDRRVVETLLEDPVAGPSRRSRAMIRAEAEGINEWLRTHEITDPACADAEWIEPDVTEIDVWYAVYLAQLIGSTSRFADEITTATPPGGPEVAERSTDAPALDSGELRSRLQGGEFGSNATAVGGKATSTKRGMLLGNPHFPWLGRYRFTQMHLTVPGKLDVAGGALIGFPAINIGFNSDVAWSHTVSTAYRFTPYQYFTAGSPTTYRSGSEVRELERRDVEVQVRTDDGVETVTRTLWRTDEGYVMHAPDLLMGWTADSFWAMRDANAEHLRTLDTFVRMGKATSVRNLLRRQDRGGGMPWVNTVAADRAGKVLYADHSVVPHVTNELAQKCMTGTGRLLFGIAGLPGLDGARAGGECAWGQDKDAQRPGILGDRHLPDVIRRDWVMNANDSYWLPHDKTRLTGYPRIIGCESCARSMRTKVVMAYVRDQLEQGKETPKTLRAHQYANRVYAAEVARAGGRLDQVCAATGETEACRILEDWDGLSDTTSVGTAIFAEFMVRANADGVTLWEVPFDAKKPLTTPRRLSTSPAVVDTMAAAIQDLRDRDVDLSAPYGTMHYSGDRGDEGLFLPLGGGLGNTTGDANAVSSGGSVGAVVSGSSHIQAIAFRGKDRVVARTMLTYGQYEDPTSPWANDQTRRFSKEKWVKFRWTEAEIVDGLVETVHLGQE